MKTKIKILVLLMVTSLTFTACKKEKEDDANSGKEHLNPPAWIQFTWTKPNGANGEDGWKFTSDDMISVVYDQNGNQIGNVSLMDSYKNKDYTISEQSTGDSYQFTITDKDTNSSESFQFNLVGTELIYTDNMQNTFIYTKRN
jgi:hypothetical protein